MHFYNQKRFKRFKLESHSQKFCNEYVCFQNFTFLLCQLFDKNTFLQFSVLIIPRKNKWRLKKCNNSYTLCLFYPLTGSTIKLIKINSIIDGGLIHLNDSNIPTFLTNRLECKSIWIFGNKSRKNNLYRFHWIQKNSTQI